MVEDRENEETKNEVKELKRKVEKLEKKVEELEKEIKIEKTNKSVQTPSFILKAYPLSMAKFFFDQRKQVAQPTSPWWKTILLWLPFLKRWWG